VTVLTDDLRFGPTVAAPSAIFPLAVSDYSPAGFSN
jgi:hypothetical protein